MAIRWFDPETSEQFEQRCSWCGGEATPQCCPGCGHPHHHGAMHNVEDDPAPMHQDKRIGYWAACNDHVSLAEEAWREARRKAREEREEREMEMADGPAR